MAKRIKTHTDPDEGNPPTQKIAVPTLERGWPRREACSLCGQQGAHSADCPNR
jgi:hypothetical protein